MQPSRPSHAVRPFTALMLALVPAIVFVRCGLWPSFPDLPDSGPTDARLDSRADAADALAADARDVREAGMDSTPDVAMPTDGGFRNCMSAPPSGPFTFERLSATAAAVTGARDLAFDGRGRLWTVGVNVTSLDPMGMSTDLTMMPVNGSGLRFMSNGDLAIVANSIADGGSLKFVDRMGAIRTVVMGLMLPQGVAVDGMGGVYFTDSLTNSVMRLAPGAMMPDMVSRDVPTPSAVALTPDFSRLYVGSSSTSRVYYIDLTAAGMPIGMATRYADGSPNLAATGLAFDSCGYLYATDRPRGRVVRIAPGGGSILEIASDMSLFPVGLAFGAGAGFNATSLYVMDAGRGEVYRLNIGVEGAPIVMPPRM